MSSDRFFGYPLAVLGGFALLAPKPGTESAIPQVVGGGGTTGNVSVATSAPEPVGAVTPSSLGDPSAAVQRPVSPAPLDVFGRPSAESAELRALRLEEAHLFPELGPPTSDPARRPVEGYSCEQPTYDMAQSVDFEIPPTKNWLTGLNRPEFSVPRDPRIAKYIRYFAASPAGRQTFATWLARSGQYREIVGAVLRKRELPSDLMAVMFVESGCWPTATSSAGAVGLWQFMPKTARAYGLTVNSQVDERRSIFRATEAALTHLADLKAQFGSWHLALAAYNYGYQQLMNRLRETRTEDFFELANRSEALPRETALYVPKVLAVATILRNLEYFGFDQVEQKSPIAATPIEVPPGTRLSLVARASGTSLRQLKDLNPELLTEIIPERAEPILIHIPNRGLARAKTMLPRLLDSDDREKLDLNVTANFDWGRDEFDTNWRSRLERTGPLAFDFGSNTDEPTRPRRDDSPEPVATEADSTTGEPLASLGESRAPEASREPPSSQIGPSGLDGDPWRRPDRMKVEDAPSQKERPRVKPEPSPRTRVKATRLGSFSVDADGLPKDIEWLNRDDGRRARGRSDKKDLAYRAKKPGGVSRPVEFLYEVKPGDTLSELALTFNVTQDRLVRVNKLRDPSRILAGSRLRVVQNDVKSRN